MMEQTTGNLSEKQSAWGPLRQHLFRSLWIAAVASNIGTWVEDVGEAWLMTSLTKSTILISLLQTAESLPIFLLVLPAGAFADIMDRRRLLIFAQIWMLIVAATLGMMTIAGAATPPILLLLGFLLGLGVALSAPAWQAIIPELVTRSDLPAAIALNGISVNIARAVGPGHRRLDHRLCRARRCFPVQRRLFSRHRGCPLSLASSTA